MQQTAFGEHLLNLAPLQESDLDQIVSIEQQSRPTPWSRRQFLDDIKQGERAFALWLDGELVGYTIVWLIADELQIQNIVVSPKKRQKGLGEWLLWHMLNRGQEQGAALALLEVRASNRPAIALYEKYQFETVGRRKTYYRDGEDALLMTLRDIDSTYKAFLIDRKRDLHNQFVVRFGTYDGV